MSSIQGLSAGDVPSCGGGTTEDDDDDDDDNNNNNNGAADPSIALATGPSAANGARVRPGTDHRLPIAKTAPADPRRGPAPHGRNDNVYLSLMCGVVRGFLLQHQLLKQQVARKVGNVGAPSQNDIGGMRLGGVKAALIWSPRLAGGLDTVARVVVMEPPVSPTVQCPLHSQRTTTVPHRTTIPRAAGAGEGPHPRHEASHGTVRVFQAFPHRTTAPAGYHGPYQALRQRR